MGFPPYFQTTRDLVTSSSGRDRMFIGVFRCLCHHYHYHRGSSALHCNWLQGRSGREKKGGGERMNHFTQEFISPVPKPERRVSPFLLFLSTVLFLGPLLSQSQKAQKQRIKSGSITILDVLQVLTPLPNMPVSVYFQNPQLVAFCIPSRTFSSVREIYYSELTLFWLVLEA